MAETKVHQKRVELMIQCTELADLDTFTKSDPMCVLFTKQFGQWRELARTEAILDQLNPKFTETMILDYDPDISRMLLFTVYDIDSSSTDLKKHDEVGSVELDYLSLLSPSLTISATTHNLRCPGDPFSRGYIHITAELVKDSRDKVLMHLGASKLDKKGFFNLTKTDTFLELCRSTGSNTHFHPVLRTEVVFNSRDPRWRPLELSVQKLCNGDINRPIQATCWHRPNNNSLVLIGSAITTVQDLKSYKRKGCMTLPLIEPRKALNKKYKHSGELKILQFRFHTQYTLLDFIRGSCSLRLTMAIDFTSSNGEPTDPFSLHSLDSKTENQYVEAIKTLGGLLAHFDVSKEIAAFGFGAKFIRKRRRYLQECFTLSGKSEHVFMKGVKGVLDAYKTVIPKLKFCGPTKLAPLIREVSTMVSQKGKTNQENQFYHFLTIVTDGVINDLDATIEAIICSAKLPISIILVGVGPAVFTSLEEMFLPDVPLKSHKYSKQVACRCNFHFVALRKQKYATGLNITLAKETLGIVSRQLISFMELNGIKPNSPALSLVDPQVNGWVEDKDNGDSGPFNSSLFHRMSPTSFTSYKTTVSDTVTDLRTYKSVNELGLCCPTCGSLIDTSQEMVIDNQGISRKR